ncbi:hypothetical protein FAGAP_1494 [Fusarium agapanthi]|uniref:Uncharacterized protein n=1 Tax=Fusarium agapanthi TaxID=1803897 RepID=A0A9P5EGL4_9HYPO|nr:hypothetical protein FAGAP_1494 [Fusarium agapanthi]
MLRLGCETKKSQDSGKVCSEERLQPHHEAKGDEVAQRRYPYDCDEHDIKFPLLHYQRARGEEVRNCEDSDCRELHVGKRPVEIGLLAASYKGVNQRFSYGSGNFNSEGPLPLTPDEVTSEWLSEALGVAVKDFKLSSVMHDTSSKVFVDLSFGDGVEMEIPGRVVLKGGFNPVIRETVPQMLPTYRLEAEFYFQVAPQTAMLLPKIWFAGTDTVITFYSIHGYG